jgi:TatD DNase family protein
MSNEPAAAFVDTHCHLDFPEYDTDRDEVIQRARNQAVSYIINIGSSLEGSKKALELTKQYDFIYATVGFHPHEADKFDEKTESTLWDFARQDKVVAIGEIGLDYYKNYSKAENQRAVFVTLLKIARELNLPVVIHNRQAEDDTLKILKAAMPQKLVVHCFSGDTDFLKTCLGLGFYISFTCNITYRKADRLRELVGVTPLERLMLETDAPFLPPEGLRGRRNEPIYVKLLAEEIARIKGISLEEVAKVTTENAKRFFSLR